MRTLKFNVKGQTLSKDKTCDFSNIVKGSENYLECLFNFGKDWEEYDKVVLFTGSGIKNFSRLTSNRILIPAEITKLPYFKIILYGTDGTQTITTNTLMIKQTL